MNRDIGFILHQRDYRDTSKILDCYTQSHGRFRGIARGIKSSKRLLKQNIQPFQPLIIHWSQRGDLASIREIESDGLMISLSGKRLMAGFYINEIILKIIPEDESDPALFGLYKTTLYDLPEQNWVSKLRSFEISILDFLGYLPSLEYEYLNNTPIETSKTYEFLPSDGFRESLHKEDNKNYFNGDLIKRLSNLDLDSDPSLRLAKYIFDSVILFQSLSPSVNSRKVMRQLINLSKEF